MFNPTHETNDNGEDVTVINIWSSLLPHLNVDTYSCFTGDHWLESELENAQENGESGDYDDYDFNYDMPSIIKSLAEANVDFILSELSTDGIIESIEVLSASSPREYNFISDSFEATYALNTAKLDAYWAENAVVGGYTPESYVEEFHDSRPGFFSSVPRWLEEEPEDTLVWLKLDYYLRGELDGEKLFEAVAEVEFEAYGDNVEVNYTK